jgi:GDPmannose 4,6-dehydratase
LIESRSLTVAIITGVSGQDGVYLAQLLPGKNYEVDGTYRRNSAANSRRIEEHGITNDRRLHLVEYDPSGLGSSLALVQKIQPDEIYNLASSSFASVTFDHPSATALVTGIGALHLLEAVRLVNCRIRFYQASASEMFGNVACVPQVKDTPFRPGNPYGVAKLHAHWMTVNYWERYCIFSSSGMLFNHESPLSDREFVTRKIAESVAKIQLGKLDVLELGDLDDSRGWWLAEGCVEDTWCMLQAETPDTFVLATHRSEKVRCFLSRALKIVGIDLAFRGAAEKEVAVDAATARTVVRVKPKFFRPAEVGLLIGSPAKAKLGSEPRTKLEQLCQMTVEGDLRRNECRISF